MAAAGFRVAVIDRDAEAASARVAAIGRGAATIIADCGDVAGIHAAFAEVDTRFGRIDVLVNNAGTTFQSSLLGLDEEGWDLVNRTNIKGAFFAMQAAAKRMVAQGLEGCIVNMGSIFGRGYPDAANPAYVATKGGLVALTWYAAHQLAPQGITVNAVGPGITMTPLLRSAIAQRAELAGHDIDDAFDAIRARVPLRRFNEPEDVAAAVGFLCSKAGRNITGQAINVDGGLVTN